MRDELGVWHVCLSMHSSRDELEQAFEVLRPRWVVSTTPLVMAMDLSYVKKHCSLSRFRADDSIWKLLGITDAMSSTVVTGSPQSSVETVETIENSEVAVTCSVEEFGSDECSQVVEVPAEPTVAGLEIRMEPPVTLFGIARFGLLDDESQLWKDEYQSVEDDVEAEALDSATETEMSKDGMLADKSVQVIEITEVAANEQNSSGEAGLKAQQHDLSVHSDLRPICNTRVAEQGENRTKVVEEISDVHHITVSDKNSKEAAAEDCITPSEIDKKFDQDSERPSDPSTVMGSPKGLNANLRRLYRSMNVSVPRPLASLVELMAASKRPRVSQTVQL
ncbi:hypothetical protein PR202_ga30932 [Eleusine coracana subsp. coracana]|uniref:DNA repair metallo-beta-lactamase domain-containing protein n=1 Tax=Eleusine coracana subsp. coracana TaxID=191504 RepID=A0AAV5DQM7_ELECO|nr:hypothetical protein PR202_ga30932 [Eleusine coracana subsp. coracana]